MAITATTITAAVTTSQTTIIVASTTGITNPNYQTGAGITELLIDQEYMLVTSVNTVSLVVGVVRGHRGSQAVAHVINSLVQSGLFTDFPLNQNIFGGPTSLNKAVVASFNWPSVFISGSADAIPSTVPGSYIVKTAGVDSMTLAAPTAAQEGNVIMIYSDTTNAHILTATTLLANGTALKTTATYAAFRGAGLVLRAVNLVWHVVAVSGVVLT